MLPIQNFINPSHTFKEIHKTSDRLEVSSSWEDTPSNYILHMLKKELFKGVAGRKMSYLIGNLNFKEILIHAKDNITRGSQLNRVIETNSVGYFKGRHNTYYDDVLVEKIHEECEKRNIIFINTTLNNFSVDEEEEERYSTHGVCIILLPISHTNKYHLYYINSHGDVIEDEESFEYHYTRSRKGTIDFDKSPEYVIMERFTEYLNHRYKLNIVYSPDRTHNYIGANLQEYDNQGMCFAYPTLLYYYFGCHYQDGKTIQYGGQTLKSDSFYNMLVTGNIDKMVYFCYSDFCENISKVLIQNQQLSGEKIYKKIINCLKKSNFRFVKKLSHALVYFINQEYFVNKIKGKYICQETEE